MKEIFRIYSFTKTMRCYTQKLSHRDFNDTYQLYRERIILMTDQKTAKHDYQPAVSGYNPRIKSAFRKYLRRLPKSGLNDSKDRAE